MRRFTMLSARRPRRKCYRLPDLCMQIRARSAANFGNATLPIADTKGWKHRLATLRLHNAQTYSSTSGIVHAGPVER